MALSDEADQFGGPRRVTRDDVIAFEAVVRFVQQTTTDQGTPLFRLTGPTADMLKVIIVDAIQRANKSEPFGEAFGTPFGKPFGYKPPDGD